MTASRIARPDTASVRLSSRPTRTLTTTTARLMATVSNIGTRIVQRTSRAINRDTTAADSIAVKS